MPKIRRTARAYLASVEIAALVLLGYLLSTGPVRGIDLVRLGILSALAIGYSEVATRSTRMQGYLGGGRATVNTKSVWSYAAVLTLPAGWAGLFVVVQYAHLALQRRQDPPGHTGRLIFSAAAAVVAQLAAAGVAGLGAGHFGMHPSPAASLSVLGGAATFLVLNSGLVIVGMWLALRPADPRELLPGRDSYVFEVTTLCLGIASAEFVINSPTLIPVSLMLVGFLHRSSVVKSLQEAARTDSKTGLLTSSAWSDSARATLARIGRSRGHVAVLLIDLDHFKSVNDSFGHLAGDRVLAAVSDRLRQELRGHDDVGRFGGEEFVVIFETSGPRAARDVADRLCTAVAELSLDDGQLRVTASIGLESRNVRPADVFGPDDTNELLQQLLARADEALYRAKQDGRNAVRVSLDAIA